MIRLITAPGDGCPSPSTAGKGWPRRLSVTARIERWENAELPSRLNWYASRNHRWIAPPLLLRLRAGSTPAGGRIVRQGRYRRLGHRYSPVSGMWAQQEASRLALKWARQRCHLGSSEQYIHNIAAMAFFSPRRAELDSSTSPRPRMVNDLRKANQGRMAQKTLHHFSPGEGAEPGGPPSPSLEFTPAGLRAGPEGWVRLAGGSAVWAGRTPWTSDGPFDETALVLYCLPSAPRTSAAGRGVRAHPVGGSSVQATCT